MEHWKIYGLLLLLAGLLIRYQVGRRRFNRRSAMGLPLYNSYMEALLVGFLEGLLRFIGLVLVLAGLFKLFA